MNQSLRKVTRKARRIKKADVGVVSFVERGANLTPFRLFKSEDATPDTNQPDDEPMIMTRFRKASSNSDSGTGGMNANAKAAASAKKPVAKRVASTPGTDGNDNPDAKTSAAKLKKQGDGLEVCKITFSAEHFEKKADVQSYLDENGFEDCTIKKEYDEDGKTLLGFVVPNLSESAFESLKMVKDDDGVIRHIGKLSKTAPTVEEGNGPGNEPSRDSQKKKKEIKIGGSLSGGDAVTPFSKADDDEDEEDAIEDDDDEEEELAKAEPKKKAGSAKNNAEGNDDDEDDDAEAAVPKGKKGKMKKAEDEDDDGEGEDEDEDTVTVLRKSLMQLVASDEAQLRLPERFLKSMEAPTRLIKLDSYAAYSSRGTSIADIIDDCNDGIPVGFSDIQTAFMAALKTLTKSGKADEIPALCAEFGTILAYLASLTAKLEKADREEAVETLMKRGEEVSEETEDSDDDDDDADDDDEEEVVLKKSSKSELAKEYPGIPTALATAFDKLTKQVASLTKANEKLQKGESRGGGKRLTMLRKSADAEEAAASAEDSANDDDKKANAQFEERLQKSVFGLSSPPPPRNRPHRPADFHTSRN